MNIKLALTAALLALGSSALMGAQAAYSGPKVELTFLSGFTGPDRPVMEDLVKGFNTANPNVTVRITAQEWGPINTQLPTLVASGRAPDIASTTENDLFNLIQRGALSSVTSAGLKTAGLDRSRFFKGVAATPVYKGKVYGIPAGFVSYAVFYNKDLLKKAGVSKFPTTKAEFLAAARACTVDKGGKKAGEAGFDAGNLDTWGVSLYNNWVGARAAFSVIVQNGGNLVDSKQNASFNTPQAVEAVQSLVDLVKDGVARPNSTEQGELAAFKQGKVCMFPSGVWYNDQFEKQEGFNFGVGFMPRIGSKKDAAWGGSQFFVLPVQKAGYDANKRAAALEFMNFMTQPAQNLAWSATGQLPLLPVVASDKKYTSQPISELFARLDDVYAMTGFPWTGQIASAFDGAWEAAYLGKKTVKVALDDGVSQANKQIAQVRASYTK